jgi:hypothetical protein
MNVELIKKKILKGNIVHNEYTVTLTVPDNSVRINSEIDDSCELFKESLRKWLSRCVRIHVIILNNFIKQSLIRYTILKEHFVALDGRFVIVIVMCYFYYNKISFAIHQ